ncbi:MAG: manganese efflux pump MntP family protein [Oscillospiraceae bacterium]|nr:manganese efflux pump MntP family protein [Oscillospiraceae bacterium]
MMILLMALSLGMDAFAVSVSCGMTVKDFRKTRILWLALYFGAFHAGMTLMGGLLGSQFSGLMGAAGRWIAFGLLLFIGVEMIWGAFRDKGRGDILTALPHRRMLILALATSIDVFAAGVSLALQHISIWLAAGLIGGMAFGLSVLGGMLGEEVGSRFQKGATIVGGLVLIALGVRSLF